MTFFAANNAFRASLSFFRVGGAFLWVDGGDGRNLFCRRGCKCAIVGVDQTSRRPLAVLLFRNCCKRNCISKDNGQFQKAKLRLRRLFSLQPKVQHYSTPASLRVTSLCGVGCLRNFVRNKAFLISRRHPERSRGEGCKDRKERKTPRRSRSFAEKKRRLRRSEQNRRRRDLIRV